MDLDIDPFSHTSRPPFEAEEVRALTAADTELLHDPRKAWDKAEPGDRQVIKRITARHHNLARLIAAGMKDVDAAHVVGILPSRISMLKNDPTFRELIGFYANERSAELESIQERLAGMTTDAMELLRERLEEEPDSISNTMLLEIAKMGADRTGNGPQSKTTNVHMHVNLAERLEAARKRVEQRTIEHDEVA